jgi:hypothetical protein
MVPLRIALLLAHQVLVVVPGSQVAIALLAASPLLVALRIALLLAHQVLVVVPGS